MDTDSAGDGTRRIMQLVHEARQVFTTVNHDPNTFRAGSISTEQCGQPKLNYTREQLQFLLERRFNSPQILLFWMLDNEQLRDVCMNMNTITDILKNFESLTLATSGFLRARRPYRPTKSH